MANRIEPQPACVDGYCKTFAPLEDGVCPDGPCPPTFGGVAPGGTLLVPSGESWDDLFLCLRFWW